MLEDDLSLASFSGTARLFPLPNLVMFPAVDQGLHIFEPRYKQMTEDALADDQLIALVLLDPPTSPAPGMDASLPPVASFGCLGRIAAHEVLPDGRFNLRLRGLSRFKLNRELPAAGRLYRRAQGQLVGDIVPSDLGEISTARGKLRESVLARFDPSGAAFRQLDDLLESETPLGLVCNLLSYALPLPLELKQQLLEEPHVITRAEILTYALSHQPRRDRPFPPAFSTN